MRILLVEDDYVLGAAVRDHMAAEGHSVDWMQRLDDTRLALKTVDYETLLLDLGLPDGRGLDLLRSLRDAGSEIPVIILTAQDQIAVRIEGLNSGADDYLVKPFDLLELSARLSAVTRRYSGQSNPALVIEDVSIDLSRKIVTKTDKPVTLTAREFAILERLCRNLGAIVTTAEIEDSLYQFGSEVESNAVQVFVSRLRKKLGKDVITTVRGIGYKMSVER